MSATRPDPKAPPSELGDLLRYWRDVRGVSQLDLSFEAGVSQRQISFIESGRSVPGRDTLLTLAQTLDVPLRVFRDAMERTGDAECHPRARTGRSPARAVSGDRDGSPLERSDDQ